MSTAFVHDSRKEVALTSEVESARSKVRANMRKTAEKQNNNNNFVSIK